MRVPLLKDVENRSADRNFEENGKRGRKLYMANAPVPIIVSI